MDYDVSVVIPTHDGWRTLRDAIDSALDQERLSVEVVVVDDASQDSTPRVAAEAALAHPDRLRVVTHVAELGELECLRSGIRAAHGRWTCLLPDDCVLMDGALAAMVEAAGAARATLVQGSRRQESAPREIPEDGTIGDSGELTDPDDTAELTLGADQATGELGRTFSPAKGRWEGTAALDQLFSTGTVEADLAAMIWDGDLGRRAVAELEPGSVTEAIGSCFLFIALTQGGVLMGCPEVLAMVDHGPRSVLDLEAIARHARNRSAADAVVAYLNRTEGWDGYFGAWETMAQNLAARAVEGFPEAIPSTQWAEASSAILGRWGAPYVAAGLQSQDRASTLAPLALAQAPELAPSANRPATIMVLVAADDPMEGVRALHDELCNRRVGVVVMSDEDVPLPESMPLVGTLPSPAHTLARLRALEKGIEDHDVSALIAFSGPDERAWDLLVARSHLLPCALVVPGRPEGVRDYLSLASQVALANSVVSEDAPASELWRLLGCRIARIGNVVSQLTLGAMAPPSPEVCTMARRIVSAIHGTAETIQGLEERTFQARKIADGAEERIQAVQDELDRCRVTLGKVIAERDEARSTLEALGATRAGERLLRRIGH